MQYYITPSCYSRWQQYNTCLAAPAVTGKGHRKIEPKAKHFSHCKKHQSSRRLHASGLVPTQKNKNLATNAIKGLSIPSRPLAKVRSDRDNKIIFFGIFMI